jgi:phage shock protein PspC (stress-responsive transcriptional regulator)
MITGVAGGLGAYFGVDAVIFRVLFAVLTFFGGVGLLMYLVCWLLIPEPDVPSSALDKGIAQLRMRRVPPWIVIAGGALALWLGWFSWWAPGPTFPALALIAILLILLVRRMSSTGIRPATAHAPYPWEAPVQPAGSGMPLQADTEVTSATTANLPRVDPSGAAPAPLVPPLNDFRRNMRDWYTESQEARRRRLARRRPIKIAVAVTLAVAWAFTAILDAVNRVPFSAYLWIGLAVVGIGFVASVVTQRVVWWFLPPLVILAIVTVGLGGTHASLRDGSGRVGWMPTSTAQLSNQQQFAGDTTVDLTGLPTLTAPRSITITQAAGRVLIRVPQAADVLIIGKVHMGDIQLGSSRAAGDYVGGFNTHLELPPPASSRGSLVTVNVDLTIGHIQIDRV